MQPEGLTICCSAYGAKETMDRLVAAVTGHGMAVLARIDHSAAAATAGLTLSPTEVLVFGNPRAGTGLMQKAQTMGIDLPLKALVWQDGAGAVWLGYNDPTWLARRHGADEGSAQTLATMTAVLADVAREATMQG